jgi:hypothetical protein
MDGKRLSEIEKLGHFCQLDGYCADDRADLCAEVRRLVGVLREIGKTKKGYQDVCWTLAHDAIAQYPEGK